METKMPIYEYRCKECGNKIEKIQNFDAKAPPCKCDKKVQMTRLISRTSFHLKGDGWAKDGYAGGRIR
jgi:putative FmdB family regulatory protein